MYMRVPRVDCWSGVSTFCRDPAPLPPHVCTCSSVVISPEMGVSRTPICVPTRSCTLYIYPLSPQRAAPSARSSSRAFLLVHRLLPFFFVRSSVPFPLTLRLTSSANRSPSPFFRLPRDNTRLSGADHGGAQDISRNQERRDLRDLRREEGGRRFGLENTSLSRREESSCLSYLSPVLGHHGS